MRPADHDVVIAGGGLIGRILAVALKRSAPGLDVVLLTGGRPTRAPTDDRASAIAAAARRMFVRLDLWPSLSADAFPIERMRITDSALDDAVRPELLSFAGSVGPREPFAYMIPNAALADAADAACEAADVRVRREAARVFDATADLVRVRLDTGETITASLLVAADGAESRLRDIAGIGTVGRTYRQRGIVTTVRHSRANDGTAIQHFLPSGPFAILPIGSHRASIVWSEEEHLAERLVALDHFTFAVELERRFGPELGEVEVAGSRHAFPLRLRLARRYVADRFALAGDAAHVIHPLAGQGLNLGLRDVATLAESVVGAHRLGLDPGGADALDAYARLRRVDVAGLALVTDALNVLFSNDLDPVRMVRDMGLSIVERAGGLKRVFVREAAGLEGEVPLLMRGEAL